MHNGDTFALDVVRERYLRPGTENRGSMEFTEVLELHKGRIYDASIASAAAKTAARERFGGASRRNDRDRDGGGSNRDNFKNARPELEATAPLATFTKDVTKDSLQRRTGVVGMSGTASPLPPFA
eukprot:jgi/Tetstr1/446813/TSEL_034293.t1